MPPPDRDLPPSQRRPGNVDLGTVFTRIDEAVSDVEKLLAELPDTASRGPDEAAGAPSEVTDISGSIRVALALDRLPRSIVVAPDWRRTVGCEGFADAVNVACVFAAAAAAAGPEQTDAPDDPEVGLGNLSAALDQVLEWVSRRAVPRDTTGTDGRGAMWGVAGIGPRPLDELFDEIMRESKAIDGPDERPTLAAPDTGSPANGRLSLTISMFGLVTCAANPDWVNQQDHESLTEALATALAAARTEHGL